MLDIDTDIDDSFLSLGHKGAVIILSSQRRKPKLIWVKKLVQCYKGIMAEMGLILKAHTLLCLAKLSEEDSLLSAITRLHVEG